MAAAFRYLLMPLQALYSFYALALFFLTAIPALLVYSLMALFPARTRMMGIYYYNRTWIGLWSLLTGIWIDIENRRALDPKETYVLAINHNNLLDIPMAGSCIVHPFQPLIKSELLRVPLLGTLFSLTSIPVNRSSPESRAASFERMVRKIQGGMSILIFPEGTRNRTEAPLKSFYDGAFRLAIATQKPVMPVLFMHHRLLQPVKTFWLRPGRIAVRFLEPIPTAGMGEGDSDRLREQVYGLMESTLLRDDRFFQRQQRKANA
jgi:1-acyl-sn-glycerol-3-phosphate acyltransferase